MLAATPDRSNVNATSLLKLTTSSLCLIPTLPDLNHLMSMITGKEEPVHQVSM